MTNNTTIPGCQHSMDLLSKLAIYMLPVAVVVIVGLSFLVRRKQLYPDHCSGRPGVLHPINFIDDFGGRWMFVTCFVICANTILGLFLGMKAWDPLSDKDNEWLLKFGWTNVFIKLLNVVHVCLVFYPLFACVAHRKHIVANIVGFLYIIPLLVVEIIALRECRAKVDDQTTLQALMIAEFYIQRIPAAICYFVLIFAHVYKCVCKAYRYWLTKQGNLINEGQQQIHDRVDHRTKHYFLYVKDLMTKRMAGRQTLPSSTSEGTKEKLLRFIKYFRLRKVTGFRYPLRLVCTLVVCVLAVIWLTVIIGMAMDYVINYIRINLRRANAFEYVLEHIDTIRVTFGIANVFSGILQLIFIGHILVIYKRRILKLLRGNRKWQIKIDASPAATLMRGMRYSGYQIALLLYGYFIATLLLWILLLLFSYIIVLPIRFGQRNWLLNKFIQLWPLIVLWLALYYAQILLCKYMFLQQRGKVVALNNRELYHVTSYFVFFLNVVVGLFAGLKRILLSAFIGAFLFGRLDYVLLMKGFERFDTGHMAYMSMLMVEVYHNHPVLRTFVDLLLETKQQRDGDTYNGRRKTDVLPPNRRQLRNRWLKLITLLNNPTLVADRLQRQNIQQDQIVVDMQDVDVVYMN